MVAQKYRPLTVVGDRRCLIHDLDDRMTLLLSDRHEYSRHHREVVSHVAFIAFAEVLAYILRPLVGLGQQHAVLVMGIDHCAHLLDHIMGLMQILVGGALANTKIGDGIQAQPVDSQIEPEAHDANHGIHYCRVVVVQIRLVRKETVPVVGARYLVPCPVGFFRIGEDDPRLGKLLVRIRPQVEITFGRTFRRAARRLKPGMLIGRVIDDQFGDHLQPAPMRFADEVTDIGAGAILRVHIMVVGNVVAIVTERRRIERQQPKSVYAEVLQVVELLGQPLEVANTIAIAIKKGFDMQLVDDRILVPERILIPRWIYVGVGVRLDIIVMHLSLHSGK